MMDDSLRGSLRNLNRNDIRDTNNNTYPTVQENDRNFFNLNTHTDVNRRTTALTYTHDSGKGPEFPQFSKTIIRLSSFKTWPTSIQQTPETMTEAGFHYTGNNVTVICFYCGIVLQFWNSEDNPLIEHARWSPECWFLKDKKGLNFIASVQDDIKRERLRRRKAYSLGLYLVEESTLNCTPLNFGSPNSVSNGDEYGRSEDRIRGLLPSGKPPTKAEKQNLLFTDAAQSMLTMGYLPKVIRIVVDRVFKEKGWNGLSMQYLLEEIYREEENGDIPKSKFTIPMSTTGIKPLTKDDVINIANQNRDMKDQMQCKICFVMPVSIVFLPCGHLISCFKCATSLKSCSVCRSEIKGSVEAKFK